MSNNSNLPASNYFTLAWAVPVDESELFSRMVAYAATKRQITAFRFALGHTTSTALRKLPEEIISMISIRVSEDYYFRHMWEWGDVWTCLTNKCQPGDHRPSDSNKGHHQSNVQQFSLMLTSLNWSTTLRSLRANDRRIAQKAALVVFQDFGVYPHFSVKNILDRHKNIDASDVRAYLKIPIVDIPTTGSHGEWESSLVTTVKKITKPSVPLRLRLTRNHMQLFRNALKKLRLRPLEDEDESDGGSSNREASFNEGSGTISTAQTGGRQQQVGENGEKNSVFRAEEDKRPLDDPGLFTESGTIWPQLMALGCGRSIRLR
ncbi:hypothetical protein ACLMJK_009561 [Lecanora helva]